MKMRVYLTAPDNKDILLFDLPSNYQTASTLDFGEFPCRFRHGGSLSRLCFGEELGAEEEDPQAAGYTR